MNTVYDLLVAEESILMKQVELLKDRMNTYPDGILEISHSRGHVQYYRRDRSCGNRRTKRTYIRKKDKSTAEALAQRDYDRRLLDVLQQRLNAVTRTRLVYEKTMPENIIRTFTTEKQSLISPLIPEDSQFVREWQEQKY